MTKISDVQMRQINAIYTASVNIAASVLTAYPPTGDTRPVANFQIETILDGVEQDGDTRVTMHFVATWTLKKSENVVDIRGNEVVRKGSILIAKNFAIGGHSYGGIMEIASLIVDKALRLDNPDPVLFLQSQISEISSNVYAFQQRNGETEQDDHVSGYTLVRALTDFSSGGCACAACSAIRKLVDPYTTTLMVHFKKFPEDQRPDMVDKKDFGFTPEQLAMAEVIAKFAKTEPMLTHVAVGMLERAKMPTDVIDGLLLYGEILTAADRSKYVVEYQDAFALCAPVTELVH